MPSARLLPGDRLHLQHGPSDLIIWAEGGRDAAYLAAAKRFETIIAEIVAELPALREMLSPIPSTRALVEASLRPLVVAVSEVLHAGQARGEVRCDQPAERLAQAFLGALAMACEKQRKDRRRPVPVALVLPDHLDDADVVPHDLGTYDE